MTEVKTGRCTSLHGQVCIGLTARTDHERVTADAERLRKLLREENCDAFRNFDFN